MTEPVTVSGEERDWFKPDWLKWECCKKCGVVRRKDGKNRPCKGIVKVALRAEPVTGEAMNALLAKIARTKLWRDRYPDGPDTLDHHCAITPEDVRAARAALSSTRAENAQVGDVVERLSGWIRIVGEHYNVPALTRTLMEAAATLTAMVEERKRNEVASVKACDEIVTLRKALDGLLRHAPMVPDHFSDTTFVDIPCTARAVRRARSCQR